jgi:hypothetical protein
MKLTVVIPCYRRAQHDSGIVTAVKNSPIKDKEISHR